MILHIVYSTLGELVKGILEIIGGTVNAIVLYGSVARETADSDSVQYSLVKCSEF